ncbi:hypothetical protein D1872_303030 [compost metagenome]
MVPLTLSGDHINDSGGTDQYCPIGESFEHHGYEKKEGIRCVYTAEDEQNRSKLGNNSDFQRRIMVFFSHHYLGDTCNQQEYRQ